MSIHWCGVHGLLAIPPWYWERNTAKTSAFFLRWLADGVVGAVGQGCVLYREKRVYDTPAVCAARCEDACQREERCAKNTLLVLRSRFLSPVFSLLFYTLVSSFAHAESGTGHSVSCELHTPSSCAVETLLYGPQRVAKQKKAVLAEFILCHKCTIKVEIAESLAQSWILRMIVS